VRRCVGTDDRALTQLTLQERRERLKRLAAMVRKSVGATLVVARSSIASSVARPWAQGPLHSVPANAAQKNRRLSPPVHTSRIVTFPNLAQFGGTAREKFSCDVPGARSHPRARAKFRLT
jgi:hypothetical protein